MSLLSANYDMVKDVTLLKKLKQTDKDRYERYLNVFVVRLDKYIVPDQVNSDEYMRAVLTEINKRKMRGMS